MILLDVLASETECTPSISRAALVSMREDAPMRDRAAENLRVQHAGHAHIVDVFGAARHLGAGFEARQAAAHLAHGSASPMVRGR